MPLRRAQIAAMFEGAVAVISGAGALWCFAGILLGLIQHASLGSMLAIVLLGGCVGLYCALVCRRCVSTARAIYRGEAAPSSVFSFNAMSGLSFLILLAIPGLMWLDILLVRHEGRRNHDALRVGMNVREIPWPKGSMVWASCQLTKSNVFLKDKDWTEVTTGRKPLPSECRKMSFNITGKVPYHAYYTIEFEEKWNILSIGPLKFHAS